MGMCIYYFNDGSVIGLEEDYYGADFNSYWRDLGL